MGEIDTGFDITNIAERALRTRNRLLDQTPDDWPVLLEAAEGVCLDHFGFDSLSAFVTAPVSKNGLGMQLEQARNMINFNKGYKHKAPDLLKKLGIAELAKGVEASGKRGEVGNGRSRVDKDKNINSTSKNKGGTSNEYRISTLKRDFPEIAKRLEAGEFKTVSEAWREAGKISQKGTELARFRYFMGESKSFVEKMAERLSTDEMRELSEAIKQHLNQSTKKE